MIFGGLFVKSIYILYYFINNFEKNVLKMFSKWQISPQEVAQSVEITINKMEVTSSNPAPRLL